MSFRIALAMSSAKRQRSSSANQLAKDYEDPHKAYKKSKAAQKKRDEMADDAKESTKEE